MALGAASARRMQDQMAAALIDDAGGGSHEEEQGRRDPDTDAVASAEAGEPAVQGRAAVFLQRLDRNVARILRCFFRLRLPNPTPPGAMRSVRRMMVPTYGYLFFFIVSLGLQFWCLGKAYVLLFSMEYPSECETLKRWLMGYCLAAAAIPVCFLVAAPAVIWWALSGIAVRQSSPKGCREEAPTLWFFAGETVVDTGISVVAVAIGAVMFVIVLKRVRRLMELLGDNGPAAETVRRQILAGPLVEPVPGADCSICLEPGSPRSARWRALRCGHRFHEGCLLEWLRRSRHCPLCRLNLQTAYLLDEGAVASPLAAGAPERSTEMAPVAAV